MKTKIVMIVFTGDSGLTHYSYNLCEALSGMRNAKVELITSTGYGLERFKHGFHVQKIFRRTRNYFIDIWKVIYYILATRPDVVHFQSVMKYPLIEKFIIDLLKKSSIKNIVFTIHDIVPHKKRFYHEMIWKWFYKGIPKVVVHSQLAYEIMVNKFKYPGAIKIIPHGEYGFFSNNNPVSCAEARRYLGLDSGEKIILFFGHIRPNKGLAYLIESFRNVITAYPHALLVIAGNPEESFQKYADMIRDSNIEDKVFTWLQHIKTDEIKFYVTAADFMVLPYSEVTTSGIAQLAYGFLKPVIATNVGNLPEVIKDGETGFLVPPRDIDKLTEKMLILLNDEAKLKKMSQAISKEVNAYSWDKIARDTLDFYSL